MLKSKIRVHIGSNERIKIKLAESVAEELRFSTRANSKSIFLFEAVSRSVNEWKRAVLKGM